MLRNATATLPHGLLVCKSMGVQPPGEAPVSLLHMTDKAVVPTENLSSWYFAVRWARFTLEQQAQSRRDNGLYADYLDHTIEQLLNMEVFLQVSWDAWMDSLQQTSPEVCRHV